MNLQRKNNMNKAELVEAMAKSTKLSKTDCKDCLEAFIKTVGAVIRQGKSVVLTGFGTFSTIKRKARTGMNPVTKKKMTIPAKKVPKFKAGKALKSQVK
jgi:DNA-binding protein HU-beta